MSRRTEPVAELLAQARAGSARAVARLLSLAEDGLVDPADFGDPAGRAHVVGLTGAPGIGKSIVAANLMTPVDIEAEYNLPGGHWHHGELQADQLLVNRPTGAASGYSTPIEGLYLASAGAHPGGGISGLPGWNAARHILSGATA